GNSASSAGVTLYSAASNKALIGGHGNDVLIGAPNDTLTGGPGADTLVFNPNFGKETVKVACTRFRGHRVRCHSGAGGGLWNANAMHESSSLRL
ncbi:MAG: hypothetical protein WCE32_06250, partial [Pseudolabrys sp.]